MIEWLLILMDGTSIVLVFCRLDLVDPDVCRVAFLLVTKRVQQRIIMHDISLAVVLFGQCEVFQLFK